jgi:hypothetical protein
VRLPVINTKLTEGNKPQRGDVMVFRYPPKPSLDYIKRVVGLPGDEVAYLNKRSPSTASRCPRRAADFFDEDTMRYFKQFEEQLGERRTACSTTTTARPSWPVPKTFPSGQLPLQCRGRDMQGARRPLLHDGRQPR